MGFIVKNIFKLNLIFISFFSCSFALKAQVDSSYLKYGRIPNHDTTIHYVDSSKMTVKVKNGLHTTSYYYSSGELGALYIDSKKDFIIYRFDCQGILLSSLIIRGKEEIHTDYGVYGQPISVVKSRRKKYYKHKILYQNPYATDEDFDKVSRLRDCVKVGEFKIDRID